jgi:hypothetical protein
MIAQRIYKGRKWYVQIYHHYVLLLTHSSKFISQNEIYIIITYILLGAHSYKNVDIQFVSGKKAIMTIYKDGISVEEIHLHEYEEFENTSEKLHALFAEKGFERLTEEETKQRIVAMQQAEEEMRNMRRKEHEEMKRRRREEHFEERRRRNGKTAENRKDNEEL